MVETGTQNEPFLKRPLCIFRSDGTGIELLYRVAGKGTRMLSEKRPGDVINMLGPLGNGWPRHPKSHTPVIVTGGVGVASVFPLAESLGGKAVMIYGARTSGEIVLVEELKPMTKELIITADDGSMGIKGNVMDGLKTLGLNDMNPVFYICGPKPMAKAVAEFALAGGYRGYVSLEEFMACGMGACMGCVVLANDGYRRVCKEGPVFNIKEIEWAHFLGRPKEGNACAGGACA